ncbi:hypothetical protein A2U01_0013435 [Trifolium medium]|uniref:Uncharacterized protein n=1 Tax=Trifolium medium TaxID=97028 RepID=A0A392MZV7_9FABA|nr:hypothetical protein [Trifolium medium]
MKDSMTFDMKSLLSNLIEITPKASTAGRVVEDAATHEGVTVRVVTQVVGKDILE